MYSTSDLKLEIGPDGIDSSFYWVVSRLNIYFSHFATSYNNYFMGKTQKIHRQKVRKRNEARLAAHKKLVAALSQPRPVVDTSTLYEQATANINQKSALEYLEEDGPRFSQ
jgi:hypothetical protein